MQSPTITLVAALAQRLRAAGVTRAFGFPGGGSNLALIEALRDEGVEFVLTRTEVGAAFMASAGAEMTRTPGVVIVGNGPGLTSVVNGVANARLDRVPLIVISDRYTDAERNTTGHQILPQDRLLKPLVKATVTFGTDALESIDSAISATLEAPRGPVHFEIPRDLGGSPASPGPGIGDAARSISGDERRLDDIAEALNRARRPVVLVGLEANELPSATALTSLATELPAPVFTTYKAKGCVDERSPWWGGIVAGSELERPLLAEADAILAVGLDPVELLTRGWPYSAPVLSIRSTADGDGYFGSSEICVTSGLGACVLRLLDLLTRRGGSDWSVEDVGSYRSGWQQRLRIPAGQALTGWRIVEEVCAHAPSDAVVAVDAGAHMFPATCFWRTRGPRSFLISNGLATMGFAVPAAVGAALARPDRTAIALTGDGGMAYHAVELETARRAGARVVIVVFNDASLSLIRIKHEANGGSPELLEFGDVQFDHWARALGAHGCRVSTPDDLGHELRDAFARTESTVIDARLPGSEYGATLKTIRG